MYAMHLPCGIMKRPNLELKIQPKQLLGSLPFIYHNQRLFTECHSGEWHSDECHSDQCYSGIFIPFA
jgi:hypothetical protein